MITTSFTKLFSSITDSSIWSECSDTKVVWVTMLAMSDQFGRVSAAVPGLSKRSGVSIQATEKALEKFLSPDIHSRTKDHEGRRIEVIDGGWRLLNHELYRELRSEEDRKEQNRQAQQRRRDKKRQQIVSNSQQNQPRSATVSHGQPLSAHTDTDTDAYKGKGSTPNSPETRKSLIKEKTEDKSEVPNGAILALQGSPKRFRSVHPLRHQLLKLWNSEYSASHGGDDYHYQEDRDDYPMDQLLSKFAPEKLMERAMKGWKSKSDFIRKVSSSFEGLNKYWNDIGNDSKIASNPVFFPSSRERSGL